MVDGNEPHRRAAAALLRSAGIPARTYPDGHAFLLTLSGSGEEKGAGCVLVALQMPGLGGLELLDCLRERGVGLPVLLLAETADVPTAAIRVIAAGAAGIVGTPFDREALLACVRASLAGQEPRNALPGADLQPPAGLDAAAWAVWARACSGVLAYRPGEPRFRPALEALARAVSDHLRDPCDPELRMLVRGELARLHLVPAARLHLGLLRHDGVDVDVAKLCGLPQAQ